MTLSLSPNRADTNESLLQTAVIDVTTSPVELKVGTTRNPERQAIIIYNDSNRTLYLGPATVAVSGANKGIPLLKGCLLYTSPSPRDS